MPGLILLFVLGFLVRLYRFDNPVADWHAFRQGDTNAVSAIYARDGVNLLYPRYFDLSNVASGLDNPNGYRFVEFPIYNALQATLFKTFGILSLVAWGRLITITATLAGAFFVYKLTKKYANETAGILSAFFYLFLPFSIFYGRTILPDPSMTASILAGIYFFDKWIEKFEVRNSKHKTNTKSKILNSKYFVLSVSFTALAFLLKPYAIFFALPIFYLAVTHFGLNIIKKWQLWLFAVATLTPLVLWRLWIGQFPEGIPVNAWLFNGNGIRFRPSFFRWIFYERIARLILGFAGVILLVEGVLWIVINKNRGFFLSFISASLIYLIVIATGNVQHDYYQILIIPTISMLAGLGTYQLFKTVSRVSNEKLAVGVCAILIVGAFFLSWKQVKDYFNINDERMVEAAYAANKILPKDAVVIAPYDNSTTFLNIIERKGWPIFQKDINELVSMGAEYLVIANPTESDLRGFGGSYDHVASTSSYLILKLMRLNVCARGASC